MIPAHEALALPAAQVSPSDAHAAAVFLAELEVHVRKYMTRNGCEMQVDAARFNPVIVAEVERVCRQAGYAAAFQQTFVQSAITGQNVLKSTVVQIRPTDEAYAEHASGRDLPGWVVLDVLRERFPRLVDAMVGGIPPQVLEVMTARARVSKQKSDEFRALLARVPDDRVELVTDALLRFGGALSAAIHALFEDIGHADVLTAWLCVIEKVTGVSSMLTVSPLATGAN